MKICGRGIGARVRDVKGVGAGLNGNAVSLDAGSMAVVSGCEAGVGALKGRSSGLRSDRSSDVGRMGCAGGTDGDGAMIGAVSLAGGSSILGGGSGAERGSKLNGLFWSLGGRGETGDISCSLNIFGIKVGEGVISGVSVSAFIIGIGGAGLRACTTSSQLRDPFSGRVNARIEGISNRISFLTSTERKQVKGKEC
jgi:hypothetical protein